MSPSDYVAQSTTVSFGSCDKRKCVTVSIVDDVILENPESFHITVERPSDVDTRITVDPAAGAVTITDDDGKHFAHVSSLEMIPILLKSGRFVSGENTLPSPRGCGCGSSVCYCV